MERTLAALCEQLRGELIGDGRTIIRGINGFDRAQPGELTYADSPQHLADALASQAAAIVVPQTVTDLQGRPGIRVRDPKLAFAVLLGVFYPEPVEPVGVHPTAVIGSNARLAEGVSIRPHACIGDNVSIGRGTVIGSGVAIGPDVMIGESCIIDPNVVIYRRTQIGSRVLIHAGVAIGGDGFGYVFNNGAYVKIPQVGNVVIEDDVELGCNVCVDRATVGSTIIRQGTKIDNLVQIAHNDRIGKHVIMSGQVGLSGTVTVGDYTILGGKAGVVDHITIGARAQVGAASVVTRSIPDGQTVWGFPARDIRETKRQMAALARLPELLKRLIRSGQLRSSPPELSEESAD